MREKTYRRLEGLSRIRGGYLSTKELLTAGLTNRQIAALTRENRLQKISHGVYYLEEEEMDKPSDHKALEMAMVNERAVVCAQSACWLHGLFRDEPERFTMATCPFPFRRPAIISQSIPLNWALRRWIRHLELIRSTIWSGACATASVSAGN